MNSVEDWWPFVLGVARKLSRRYRRWSPEELASWGYDGLVSGLRCYRARPGWSLRRYLGYRIAGSIVDGMRQVRWQLLPESRCSVDELVACGEDWHGWAHLLAAARAPLRPLVIAYYCDGLTLREISVARGISEARVCQLLAEARAEIRLELEKNSG